MNLKRFSIIASVIIGLIIATIITLSCIKVDSGLDIDNPSKIIVYAKNSVGVQYSMEETPSKYKKAKKCYEDMTNLSIFDYMVTGKSLKQKPSQDINQKYETWKESNKNTFYCVELIFKEKQSVIVTIDGKTKVVEFYALIMKVDKTTTSEEVAMYFSTSEGTSKSYSTSPILINAKQNKLYDLAKSLVEKD